MSGTTRPLEGEPAFGISIKGILDRDGRREIVFQTYLAQSASDKTLNDLLDKAYRAIDRQMAKQEIEQLKRDVVSLTADIERMGNDLVDIETRTRDAHARSGKRGSYEENLPATEKQARSNIEVNIERNRRAVTSARERLVELHRLVTPNADDVAADRHQGASNR